MEKEKTAYEKKKFMKNCLEKILSGESISREEASELYEFPTEELCEAGNMIRNKFCGNDFDICTIINAKSGRCSEDCKFCAQSSYYHTEIEEYSLLEEEIVQRAMENSLKGVLRYSIVTSGKKLSENEVDKVCGIISKIKKKTDIEVCVSAGLLDEHQFRKLREAGVTRVHNNLEASEKFFPKVCTTHSSLDKKRAIKAAKQAGLKVCSGGIFGLGESIEDRIDMAFELREQGVCSVPINILNPIPNTPFEENEPITEEEIRKMVAVYRFVLPGAAIRLAGGRGQLEDKGKSCFESGANAVISGDMLTTSGITVEKDIEMIEELGFRRALINE